MQPGLFINNILYIIRLFRWGQRPLKKLAIFSSISKSLTVHVLCVPNLLRILLDAAIRAEEAHPRHSCDRLREPLVLVLVRPIDKLLRVDVALEVV